MNQIICTFDATLMETENFNFNNKNYKKRRFYKYQFSVLIVVVISLLVYYTSFRYDLYSQAEIAENMAKSFGITSIYSNNINYNAELLSQNENFYENSSYSVIGVIDIKKINISYPILSDISNDFLKISPCRFFGPMPNEVR